MLSSLGTSRPRAVAMAFLAGLLVSADEALGQVFSPPVYLNSTATTDGPADHDFRPSIATDGTTWVTVYSSTEAPGSTLGDWDVMVSRSTDAGATWSAPEVLNSNATTDTRQDFTPRIVHDGNGVWLTVWQAGCCFMEESDILFSRSTDAGATWSPVASVNTNAATDTGEDWLPSAATDGAGTWIVTWHSNEDLAGAGTDRDIFFARSTDGGVTWSPPATLNTAATDPGATYDDLDPLVVTDGAGTWGVVWRTSGLGNPPGAPFSRSTDDGLTWSAPAFLPAGMFWDLKSDGATFVGVTDASAGGARDIAAVRSTDAGLTWGTPVHLETDPAAPADGDDGGGKLAKVGANWVVVWASNDFFHPDRDIRFASSGDGGFSWTPEAYVDANAPDAKGDAFPSVAAHPPTIVIVWEGYASGQTGDQDIRVTSGSLPGVPTAPAWALAAAFLAIVLATAVAGGRGLRVRAG